MKALVGIATSRDADVLASWTVAARGIDSVVAVCVVPSKREFNVGLSRGNASGRRLLALAEEGAERVLNRFERAVADAKTVETRVIHGDVAATLVKAARQEQIGVTVVGSQGPHRSAPLRGHVAARVGRYSKSSVLVVDHRDAPPKRAVFATDGSKAAGKGADVLRELSFETLESVTVCSAANVVVPPLHRSGMSVHTIMQLREDLEDAAYAEASRVAAEAASGLRDSVREVQTTVALGNPIAVITDARRTSGADVVVMGAKGASRPLGFLLGSTSASMLQRASGSLLLGR